MKVSELQFREYYHRYMILEADVLTDKLKDTIPVKEEDCYVLVTAYAKQAEKVSFPVLALGSSFDHCRRGLRRNAMLGEYSIDEVINLECRMIEPDLRMREKAERWLAAQESEIEEDILTARLDHRLDDVRDPYRPDIVRVGILTTGGLRTYRMEIQMFDGPFIVGKMVDKPHPNLGIHYGDVMRAIPYYMNGQNRLLMLFYGDHLSEEQQKVLDEIKEKGNDVGLGFSSLTIKN